MPATASLDSYAPLNAVDQSFTSIPPPKEACKLSVMKTGQLTMPGFLFVKGFQGDMQMSDFSFLIEHPEKGRILFDMGLRKHLAYAPKTKELFDTWPGEAPYSILDFLEPAGIPIESIQSVIFSHTHFDHIGDTSLLPKSVDLVFGSYSDRSKVEDLNKLSTSLHISPSVLQNRNISHLTDHKDWQDIGSLRGIDYFGDGSLYLLDTPGHFEGHISALACIQTEPEPLYHLLGGDAAHHISLIEPEKPASIGVYKAKENERSSIKDTEPEKLQCFEDDIEASYKTMAKLARFEMENNVNVFLAHDSSMDPVLEKLGSLDKLIPLKSADFTAFKKRSRVDILQQKRDKK